MAPKPLSPMQVYSPSWAGLKSSRDSETLGAVSQSSSWSPNIQEILAAGLLSTSQCSVTELPSITSDETFTHTERGPSGRKHKRQHTVETLPPSLTLKPTCWVEWGASCSRMLRD